MVRKARNHLAAEGQGFRLPPVADAHAAAALVAACDDLQERLDALALIANPLHQPHEGRWVWLQRLARLIVRPTLRRQAEFNAATVEALRAAAAALQAMTACLAPERGPS
jgi:hypothetical protein